MSIPSWKHVFTFLGLLSEIIPHRVHNTEARREPPWIRHLYYSSLKQLQGMTLQRDCFIRKNL